MGSTGTTVRTHHYQKEGVHRTQITRMGIDVAKPVFQLHGVDERGHTVLRRRISRTQRCPFFAQLRPCLVGIEACGSAHHWARTLATWGHDVRLQAVLTVHRARQLLVAERTALVNQTRGWLAEYGLIVSTGVGVWRRALPELLESPELPALARDVFADWADRLRALDERIAR